jgi:hypothetical protein
MSDLPQAKGIKKTSRVAIVTVLLTLFALPIVAYLFFLNGEHHFKKLPVVTQKIGSISQFEVLHGDPAKLEGHVTLVNFLGNQPYKRLGYVSNLNEKIYKKFHEFKDFQMVSVVDYRGANDVAQIIEQMKATTDLTDWHFIAGSPAQIEQFFKTFGTPFPLNEDNSSDLVYIIDKDANLRGRTQDEKMDDGRVYGYESATAAGLNERMVDDMRVLLAEYRFAFKKNRDQRIQEDE